MQTNEPVRILSDLHLGMASSKLQQPGQLLPLLRDQSRVIFNGDSVEIHYIKHREEGLRHAEGLRKICAQAGTAPCFLNGNHDPNISDSSHADLAGGAVLVTHGDMLFHKISPWSYSEAGIMERAHTEALAEIEDDALLNFEKRLHASKRAALALELHEEPLARGPLARATFLLRELWPPTRPFQILKCWRQTPGRAAKLAEIFRPRAQIIVIGHTHHAGIWRVGPRIVINTGSFMMLAKRYAVDVEESTVSVKNIVLEDGNFTTGNEIARFETVCLPG